MTGITITIIQHVLYSNGTSVYCPKCINPSLALSPMMYNYQTHSHMTASECHIGEVEAILHAGQLSAAKPGMYPALVISSSISRCIYYGAPLGLGEKYIHNPSPRCSSRCTRVCKQSCPLHICTTHTVLCYCFIPLFFGILYFIYILLRPLLCTTQTCGLYK